MNDGPLGSNKSRFANSVLDVEEEKDREQQDDQSTVADITSHHMPGMVARRVGIEQNDILAL